MVSPNLPLVPNSLSFLNGGRMPRGRFSAILHEGSGETSRYEEFIEALTPVSTKAIGAGRSIIESNGCASRAANFG
jgi:hypothetical protein